MIQNSLQGSKHECFVRQNYPPVILSYFQLKLNVDSSAILFNAHKCLNMSHFRLSWIFFLWMFSNIWGRKMQFSKKCFTQKMCIFTLIIWICWKIVLLEKLNFRTVWPLLLWIISWHYRHSIQYTRLPTKGVLRLEKRTLSKNILRFQE